MLILIDLGLVSHNRALYSWHKSKRCIKSVILYRERMSYTCTKIIQLFSYQSKITWSIICCYIRVVSLSFGLVGSLQSLNWGTNFLRIIICIVFFLIQTRRTDRRCIGANNLVISDESTAPNVSPNNRPRVTCSDYMSLCIIQCKASRAQNFEDKDGQYV